MALAAGSRIGAYEIVALLGAGGMGEVYKARDTRLERTVAIKILPAHVASNPDLKQRFGREAKALAALSDPHICPVFDVGRDEGVDFLVMEFLEGETLAERLTKGPLPLAEGLRIAAEIAGALATAHRAGVVHRDLKPGNVMLTTGGGRSTGSGHAKLLDFGLARRAGPGVAPEAMTSAPTQAAEATLTARGTILGTFQYMAPEQIEGDEADARTDIFAFGCVLFEMLTGQKAFGGKSAASLMGAILKDDPPPVSHVTPLSPPILDRIVRTCLAKDANERVQSAHDLRLQLEWIRDGPSAATIASVRAASGGRLGWIAAAVMTAVAGGVTAWVYSWPSPIAPVVRFVIPSMDTSPYTDHPGGVALSPDGRHLAFVATTGGKPQLWVRDLDTLSAQLLPTDAPWHPTWSPDSRFLLSGSSSVGTALKKVDIRGGSAVTVTDWAAGNASWGTSGVILFSGRDHRLYRMPAAGGAAAAVTELDTSRQEAEHEWPLFLPDGRRFIFHARSTDPSKSALYVASVDSPARTHLVDVQSSAAYARGYLFYQRAGTLMAQRLDERTGQLSGEATPIVNELFYNSDNGRAAFSVSWDGTLAYRTTQESRPKVLTWFDADGRQTGVVGDLELNGRPAMSRDGRRLAVSRSKGDNVDIWTIDLERNVPTRVTSDPAIDEAPIWSADDSHIIFRSNRKGRGDLYQRPAGGGGTDELLFESFDGKAPTSVSPDGSLLLFTRAAGGTRRSEIWALPLKGERTPFRVIMSDSTADGGMFSPDGRWIAYTADDTGVADVYVEPFPTTGARVRVSPAGGSNPQWTDNGRQVVYNAQRQLVATDMASPARPGTPRVLFALMSLGSTGEMGTRAARVSPDWLADRTRQRFLVPMTSQQASTTPITVVLNFVDSLSRK